MGDFKLFKEKLQRQFNEMIKEQDKLFLTDVMKDELWECYLSSFPDGTNDIYKERRIYDCSSCRHFIKSYGNVISIKNNKIISMWDIKDLEYPFNIVSEKMSKLIKSKSIKDVFVTKFSKLGTNQNKQLLDDGKIIKWEHFYFELPKKFVDNSSYSIDSIKGEFRDYKNVFKRSMDELTIEAAQTILELIVQKSLYRGDEFKDLMKIFIEYKNKYNEGPEDKKDIWLWVNSIANPIAKIRNTAIGTLLIDISNDIDLNEAVTKFEKIMAPTNYKRPKAIFTKKMVEEAENKIKELGLEDSLSRRFSVLEDISVNNVLFVNRDSKRKINGSVFDDLKESVPENIRKFDKIEEIDIEKFVKEILPMTNDIEVLIENRHKSNFMSLIAPENINSPSILKWGNNFSWSYNGNIADSMKQNVKNAGGNVDGILRFSIQWNEEGNNQNDYDAHCIEPKGNHIHFPNKGRVHFSSGMLDVDIIEPGNKIAVENITWTNADKMLEGVYKFYVHNYSDRGGKNGFRAEIEYDGQIYSYEYANDLKQDEIVIVAEIKYDKKNGIEFIKSLDSSLSTKKIWGVKTNVFSKVSVFMFSPNYWDEQKGIGNKHYFFFLENCINKDGARGFYNEFLNESLMEQKRVFEALGTKMSVKDSNEQLSGVGFSTTQRNSVVVKINGTFSRVLKIKF